MLDLLLISLAVGIVTLWFQSKPFFWKGKGISWSLPLPLVGSTGRLFVKPWHKFWLDLYVESGDHKVIGYHHFSKPALMIKDPDLLKKVTVTDADHFTDREFHRGKVDPISRSLFFVGGQEWRNQRAKLTPYFTPARIKAMLPQLHSLTDTFLNDITNKYKNGPIDTQRVSLQYSTDAVVSLIFGLKPDSFENPNSFFFHLQKDLIGFDTGLRVVIGMLSPSLYDFLGLTFFRTSAIRKLSTFVEDVINQRSQGIGVRPDFMQGMVELLKEYETTNPKQDGTAQLHGSHVTKLDRQTVLGQCMMMYLAGTETTGNTLGFLMYELTLQPDIQDKVRQEINTMIEESNGVYGVENIRQLKYTHQVINETVRKYPVVAEIGRKCTKKYNLDGLEIPVGTFISIPVLGIQRDPKYYPNPNKFDPDRFSDSSAITPLTFLPFGSGPRTCIGMKLAEIEITLALIKVLSKFKLVKCPETPSTVIFTSAPSFCSGIPLWVKFEPIL